MKIDAHQHYWLYNEEEFPWLEGPFAKLCRDFLPADVKPEMDSIGYEGCIAVQARENLHETSFLLDLADRFPSILGVVGWLDLASESIEIQLESFDSRKRLVGVRAIAQGQPEGYFFRPGFLAGVGLLSKFNLTYDILVFCDQLVEATQFAARFPEQPFVVDHCAKPPIKARHREPWASDIKELAKLDHVVCKLSGLVTEADLKFWTEADLWFYAETVLEAFGPSRVMIGSDWPVCLGAGEYGQIMRTMERLLNGLSDSERVQVLGGTAREFYRV